MSDLLSDACRLIDEMVEAGNDHGVVDDLKQVRRRIDEPLRVAVAGRVKAGKSTLVNAMVGELVAATDAAECTKVVTWYRDGTTYRVEGIAPSGQRDALRFDRDDRGLRVDLGDRDPGHLSCIEVTWPSPLLREMILIDTPGIGSVNRDVSARTESFLGTHDDRPAAADAVLYLLRHVHTSDLRFLEAFHDDAMGSSNPLNSIGVLSRADEIGVARSDAMTSAARIAGRWRNDRRMVALVQNVIPIAGLLAEGARTLRQDEFDGFAALARSDRAAVDDVLISVDRFAQSGADVGLDPERRRPLLDRFGLFGCRLAVATMRTATANNARGLAEALLDASGLPTLRAELADRFMRRARLLKARQALLALQRHAEATGDVTSAAAVERLLAGAHELAEVRVLNLLRTGAVTLPGERGDDARRILGEAGLSPAVRAGIDPGSNDADVVAALAEHHARWRSYADNPLATPEVASVAEVVVRTCEGLIAALTAP